MFGVLTKVPSGRTKHPRSGLDSQPDGTHASRTPSWVMQRRVESAARPVHALQQGPHSSSVCGQSSSEDDSTEQASVPAPASSTASAWVASRDVDSSTEHPTTQVLAKMIATKVADQSVRADLLDLAANSVNLERSITLPAGRPDPLPHRRTLAARHPSDTRLDRNL